MEPPLELLMPLLPYQKEFLAWGVAQEQGPVQGGILADEMGEPPWRLMCLSTGGTDRRAGCLIAM